MANSKNNAKSLEMPAVYEYTKYGLEADEQFLLILAGPKSSLRKNV